MVVCSLAAAPWLMGLEAERLYREALSELLSRGYRIEQDEYRRGWLGARTLTVVAPPPLADPAALARPRLQLVSRITHGARGRALLHWPPLLAAASGRATVIGSARALPPLLVDARIDLERRVAAELRLPDVSYTGASGRLRLSGGRAGLRSDPGAASWHGWGELPTLEAIGTDGRTLTLHGLGWRIDASRPGLGLVFGRGELSVAAIALGGAGGTPSFSAAGLGLTLEADPRGERVDLTAAAALDRLRIHGADYAPLRLRLALTGVDAASLLAIRDAVGELNARSLPESLRGLAFGAILARYLPDVLAGEPRLSLDPVELMTPDGPLSASLSLRLADMDAAGLREPLAWLTHLAGEARVALPQPLLLGWMTEQQRRRVREELMHRGEGAEPLPTRLELEIAGAAQAALARLIHERWLIPGEGRLRAAAELGDGRLAVNGKAVPINGVPGP